MEDCLQHLANQPETPMDEVLVAIAKICKVLDDVNTADFGRVFESDVKGPPRAPPILHVKCLVADLNAVKETLPPSLLVNSM